MKHIRKLRALLDWKDWAAIAASLSAAAALSLSNITRWSIWFDEAFSEHLSRHSFFDIARYTIADVHPPLYYWVLKVWCMVFGRSELALRSLSLVFLLIAIAIAYVLVRALFSRRSAVFSSVLLAFSPMLFRYGIEARMYTMEVCIVVAATVALAYAVRHKSRGAWVTYGVLIAVGMFTHYLSLMVWVAQGLWLLWQNRAATVPKTVRSTLRRGYGTTLLTALLLYAAWLPFMIWQFLHIQTTGFWVPSVTINTVPNLISNMYTYYDSSAVQGWFAVLLIAVVVVTVYAVLFARRSLDRSKRQAYSLVLVTALVPPLLLFLGSMPPLQPAFVDRYLLSSITFWFMAIGIALADMWRMPSRALFAKGIFIVTMATLVIGCVQVYVIGNFNKDNGSVHTMRQAMQLIARHARGTEPVITDYAGRYYAADYYQLPGHKVYFQSQDSTTDGSYAMLRGETSHKIVNLAAFGKRHSIAWYITSEPRGVASNVPVGWRVVRTYLVQQPSLLRVIKMQYVGG